MASKPGDLAYLLTKTGGFKTTVNGPFVICELSEWHAELRISGAVHGQQVNQFKVHRGRVARCTTVTAVLEDQLKHVDMLPATPQEEPSSSHGK